MNYSMLVIINKSRRLREKEESKQSTNIIEGERGKRWINRNRMASGTINIVHNRPEQDPSIIHFNDCKKACFLHSDYRGYKRDPIEPEKEGILIHCCRP